MARADEGSCRLGPPLALSQAMKRLLFLFAVFCAAFLPLAAGGGERRDTPPAFRVIGLEDRPRLAEALLIEATQARLAVIERAGMDWEGTALLVWTTEGEFMERTGFRPEHIFAAASPSQMTVWINEAAWSRSSPRERRQTLAHEIGHLLLGVLPGGRQLPLWANEGIVMHLAGQWTMDDHARLLWAHLFGRLPDLADLEEAFPRDASTQALAYRMSYAAVSVLAQSHGDDPGEVQRLLWRLVDEQRGPRFAEELRDPFIREGWQIATQRSLGNRFVTGVTLLTGSGALFLLAAFLVIVGFLLKRNRAAERYAQEEEEEAWMASLTDDDIRGIYGDPEDEADVENRQ